MKTLITLPTVASIDATARDKCDERQRWAAVYYALHAVLHAATHGEQDTEKVDFDRRDGQAVIAIARDWS